MIFCLLKLKMRKSRIRLKSEILDGSNFGGDNILGPDEKNHSCSRVSVMFCLAM